VKIYSANYVCLAQSQKQLENEFNYGKKVKISTLESGKFAFAKETQRRKAATDRGTDKGTDRETDTRGVDERVRKVWENC